MGQGGVQWKRQEYAWTRGFCLGSKCLCPVEAECGVGEGWERQVPGTQW